jgi:hypothetical protein
MSDFCQFPKSGKKGVIEKPRVTKQYGIHFGDLDARFQNIDFIYRK